MSEFHEKYLKLSKNEQLKLIEQEMNNVPLSEAPKQTISNGKLDKIPENFEWVEKNTVYQNGNLRVVRVRRGMFKEE